MNRVAIVFDLFGTLLDIGSLRAELMPVIKDSKPFVQTWRDRLLMYMLTTAAMRRYESFDELADHALVYAASLHHVSMSEAYRKTLVDGWRFLRPFVDVVPTLRALNDAGVQIAALTNASPETGDAAIANAGLSELIHVLLSVESIQTYKPDPRAYELITSHFAETDRVVFVTSEGWDATGAAEFGMQVVWCNRGGAPPETLGANPTWTISSLRELYDLVTSEAIAV
ncbi:MAG TPA: haloacid dehalogenase type II [Candidatus Binatia bacterium]|nr:haloacid dehalogenase type II [Candidatus Binatia bacterium]